MAKSGADLPATGRADGVETAGDFLAGRILIAMPAIGDPRFHRAVLLICAHDEDQAMAVMLNRPFEGLTVPGVLKRLGLDAAGAPEAPVLFGGPVEPERGHVVHTDDYWSPGSTLAVGEGLALTDTRDVLEALGVEARRPRRSLLALGYAGWSPGQLDRELHEGAWLTCDPDDELVFGRDYEHKWTWALAKLGVTADRLSTEAGTA
jgi:putative transcriptional regulator